jgi:hypothetical protein
VTIRDNLSPRERQVAETLAGLREDPAHDFPLEGDPMDLDPLGTPPEAPKLSEVDRARREAQAEREMTAFWICPRCRAQNRGDGDACPECEWTAE